MPISVDLPVFSTLRAPLFSGITRVFDVPFSGPRVSVEPTCTTARTSARGISVMCVVRDSAPFEARERDEPTIGNGSGFVEVVVIGSRQESIMDSCLGSPFRSLPLRFWSIEKNKAGDLLLHQRLIEDHDSKTMNPALLLQSRPRAIILVASSGYGSCQIGAIDILNEVRSWGGLAVAILLKPFSFEGRRRLAEVNDLAGKLQQHTSFRIDIDIEMLLQKDLVTLDEALKNANNAISMAVNATCALLIGMHGQFIDVMHKDLKELKASEVTRILSSYKEAKVGFGVGHNLKTSILRAIYDCPFFRPGIKGVNAIICVVATSAHLRKNELQTILLTFRQTIEYMGDIVISTVHEPDLERKVLVTTFFIPSYPDEVFETGNIISRLFPFVLSIFKRDQNEQKLAKERSLEGNKVKSVKGTVEDFDGCSEGLQELSTNGDNDPYTLSEPSTNEFEPSRNTPSDLRDEDNIEDYGAFRRAIASWGVDQENWVEQKIPQKWAEDPVDTAVLGSLSIVSLPVGVRSSNNTKIKTSNTNSLQEIPAKDDLRAELPFNPSILMRDFNDTASNLLNEKYADIAKQRNLSARAASMLEAERDSPKRWSPILEMQYREGLYRGRCQGGLPEGKGRLVLGDGSIYDGMWHNGKRSGLGTFYFKNGDVFQGTWREDLIHGKGWFYFHNGDRWFANFWKGKANGEGRFYSKSGDIFFGHFKDGWRHGHFLCIDVDGTRYSETWDDGVLLAREQADAGD
ncbi:PREDICTED: protein ACCUMULATION AND REPLICATION OF CHLOROPLASTS 3 isoform X2 [Tarenaya hassleriana]|uniref:protein ACCUMULATION AND REPLICATION OF CHLOROPLASTS 3 isoform X2 n=1 Tax=Tarenaya hassleriana TaxID=28532 RepID=UPI00053C3106|nr:PREDICTED: protein ACCUMULATION AND REPLICATION OF CHLOROPLASTS 3 isoform X2 [Tarenaya hassleriana]